MKWAKRGELLAVSNTMPEYRVAKFYIVGQEVFRASFKGEFLGRMTEDPKEAQAICERHHTITQEAKEVTSDQKEQS